VYGQLVIFNEKQEVSQQKPKQKSISDFM